VTFVGRRQQHFDCDVATSLDFAPAADGDEAGLAVWMNPSHHYDIFVVRREGRRHVAVRRRIGGLAAVVADEVIGDGAVTLSVRADRDGYTSRPRWRAASPACTSRCMPRETAGRAPRRRSSTGSTTARGLLTATDAWRWRLCHIERSRFWLAEYWISSTRDYVLMLACLRRGLPTSYGRGFDDLPPSVRDPLKDALVASLGSDELLRALGCAIEGLLRESDQAPELAAKVEPQLRALVLPWDD
jgi:hypothetical protein